MLSRGEHPPKKAFGARQPVANFDNSRQVSTIDCSRLAWDCIFGCQIKNSGLFDCATLRKRMLTLGAKIR